MDKIAQYAAMKAAIAHFTRNLAKEYGPKGVRVNQILPGRTLNEQMIGDAGKTSAERFALANTIEVAIEKDPGVGWTDWWTPRLGIPQDIADAVAFLVSDRATYINGALLNVDGGSG
jgi:NAD(P)-dependent dehydrogenase (short-subunit alcohol dehydrogenase family)